METDQIRDSFLNFFSKKGHTLVPSDSLVPANDPSVLFTGAGMNQFKDNFLGIKKNLKRAASSQKCLRTGDLENVGKTPYHHSFFEMLGNFSFGDYFKEEAIVWAWEYLTKDLKISPSRLRISVHKEDAEAYKIWADRIHIRSSWIYALGDKTNFWPANAPADGPNGPCGPCSEIYYDQDPSSRDESIESPRFAEIWNLVFTEYNRIGTNRLEPLAQKNIDTGMGLERLACVLQGKTTNYETDVFVPLLEAIGRRLDIPKTAETAAHIYAIADHARACVFGLADGIIPSNEGRGYVIRKLIRRALWRAHQLKSGTYLERPLLYTLVPVVGNVMHRPYPEIRSSQDSIAAMLRAEEEKFLATLDTGVAMLDQKLNDLQRRGTKLLPHDIAFELYDTYGFPDELTYLIAESRGFACQRDAFEVHMKAQRKRAKEASKMSAEIFPSSELEKKMSTLPATKFVGYETLECPARIIFSDVRGNDATVVLDQSPFYAESGGQVGDSGTLEGADFCAEVIDTKKKDNRHIHYALIVKGRPANGLSVTAKVDARKRAATMRNHTATHLLHAALRKTLGPQVRQLGSLVSPEKLRFDYSYAQALTTEQVAGIEDLVNGEILKNSPVGKEEKSLSDAKNEGALAFFGDKYDAQVRVVSVPGFSKELCGGTHCRMTGDIGSFFFLSDTSIASGTRRIEAVTGDRAIHHIRSMRDSMNSIAVQLKTQPKEALSRIQKLQDQIKQIDKNIKSAPHSKIDPKSILESSQPAGNLRLVMGMLENIQPPELRTLYDKLKTMSDNSVFLLGTVVANNAHFVLGLSGNLDTSQIDARELWKKFASVTKATGGGRKDFVQGGVKAPGNLQEFRENVQKELINHLKLLNLNLKN